MTRTTVAIQDEIEAAYQMRDADESANVILGTEVAYWEREMRAMLDCNFYVVIVVALHVAAPERPNAISLRRPSHMARSFTREGGRYAVRKDHGTTARRKQIEATNARWSAGAQSPDGRRALRRELRKALYGGEGSAYEITGASI